MIDEDDSLIEALRQIVVIGPKYFPAALALLAANEFRIATRSVARETWDQSRELCSAGKAWVLWLDDHLPPDLRQATADSLKGWWLMPCGRMEMGPPIP